MAYGLFFTSLILSKEGHATTYGIIGGYYNDSGNKPYQGLVSENGVVTPMTGDLATSGQIHAVDINASGYGIIAGDGYAAIVSPTGVATALTPTVPSTGQQNSVAINSTQYGMIGGGRTNTSPSYIYAGLVSPTGVVTELFSPTTEGGINSVDINDSRLGIIGGTLTAGNLTYAALVSPSGDLTPISGANAPSSSGAVNSVAINNSGNGIIGGLDNSNAYLALISPSGVATSVSGDTLIAGGFSPHIVAVDIGNGDYAIAGGYDGNGIYLVTISPSGVATKVTGPGAPSVNIDLRDVAINASGTSLVGGLDGSGNLYAAMISSSGVANLLTGDITKTIATGEVYAVAIADSGVGLIGGYQNDLTSFQALVAPDGTTTNLTGYLPPVTLGSQEVLAVAIADEILAAVDPKSFGSGNAFASSIFTLSSVVLSNHIRKPDKYGSKVDENNPQLSALTADATDKIYYAGKPNSPMDEKYAVWLAPFGTYERIKKHDAIPTIRDRSIGALLGFDYNGWEEGMIGGGLAYSFQDVHYSQSLGKGKVNQELATIYGAWYGPYVTIEAALWGGLYQFRNYRKTLGFIESKSTIHGWLFAPHLGVEAPFKMSDSFLITPFVQFDWVNNWQGKVREHGSSGLNLRIGSHYASVLRSEVGLRLTQYKEGAYGTFKFEEGASYVNQAPFNANKVSTYFVGSASTFDVQLFDDKVQNIGALYLGGWFIPNNRNIPEFGVNYQGEWGNILFSQTLSLEMTYRF